MDGSSSFSLPTFAHANDFLMCFGLSDCELIFISDFVEIPLVSVMEMTQCIFFFALILPKPGLGPNFSFIN